jgi:ribosomal protein S18 acetylase RimI-like enzyme
MEIRKITQNKKQFLVLLLLADEQESMVDLYLERGKMYIFDDNGVKAECVVTDEGNGILELKNLAVSPDSQGKGYGRQMIAFLRKHYAGAYNCLQAGTGGQSADDPVLRETRVFSASCHSAFLYGQL